MVITCKTHGYHMRINMPIVKLKFLTQKKYSTNYALQLLVQPWYMYILQEHCQYVVFHCFYFGNFTVNCLPSCSNWGSSGKAGKRPIL